MIDVLGGAFDYSASAVKARMFKQAAEFYARDGRTMVPVNSTGRDSELALYATSAPIAPIFQCSTAIAPPPSEAVRCTPHGGREMLACIAHKGIGSPRPLAIRYLHVLAPNLAEGPSPGAGSRSARQQRH